jgi:hypothetical protein
MLVVAPVRAKSREGVIVNLECWEHTQSETIMHLDDPVDPELPRAR